MDNGQPIRILILCTGNSCHSQMAHGFLQSFDGNIDVHSAGTEPAAHVHPFTVAVMPTKRVRFLQVKFKSGCIWDSSIRRRLTEQKWIFSWNFGGYAILSRQHSTLFIGKI